MKPVSKNLIYIALLAMAISPFGQFQTTADEEETPGEMIVSDRNLRNAAGKKVGLWIENNGLMETYYKDGLRDGVFKSYFGSNGRLDVFGEYRNGNPAGIWYFFNEKGHLILLEKEIGKNPGLTVKGDDGRTMRPPFKSYVIEYHPNGMIKEEGIALYEKSIQIDFYKKKIWRYYDPSGKLIRTEDNN
jgi:antitoxin component YwqK of YwqJK toxin-antitoxin module